MPVTEKFGINVNVESTKLTAVLMELAGTSLWEKATSAYINGEEYIKLDEKDSMKLSSSLMNLIDKNAFEKAVQSYMNNEKVKWIKL